MCPVAMGRTSSWPGCLLGSVPLLVRHTVCCAPEASLYGERGACLRRIHGHGPPGLLPVPGTMAPGRQGSLLCWRVVGEARGPSLLVLQLPGKPCFPFVNTADRILWLLRGVLQSCNSAVSPSPTNLFRSPGWINLLGDLSISSPVGFCPRSLPVPTNDAGPHGQACELTDSTTPSYMPP